MDPHMKPRILYIINGMGFSKSAGIGGSDKRAAEIGKRLSPRFEISMLTTSSGYVILKRESFLAKATIINAPHFIIKIDASNIGKLVSYAYAILRSVKVLPMSDTIVYSSSDFLCDTIPAYMLKRKRQGTKIVFMIHHLIDVPWKREGSFFTNLLNYISQQLSLELLKRNCDLVLVYDTLEGEKIRRLLINRGYSSQKIKGVKNGINLDLISNVSNQNKLFDACFMGGLRSSKGIFDLIPIWAGVVKAINDAKLIIIGGGAQKNVAKLKREIDNLGLQRNVILTGPLSGEELFEKVKQCKIFLMPSHEEGWGIAVCEAMCCGLPVVAYDLPGYSPFHGYIITVPRGNVQKYTIKIVELLNDPTKQVTYGEKSRDFVKKYSWDHISQEESLLLKELL